MVVVNSSAPFDFLQHTFYGGCQPHLPYVLGEIPCLSIHFRRFREFASETFDRPILPNGVVTGKFRPIPTVDKPEFGLPPGSPAGQFQKSWLLDATSRVLRFRSGDFPVHAYRSKGAQG